MRHQGRITTWKDDRGFGFITPEGGGEEAFVHIKDFDNRQRRPSGNEAVTYRRNVDEKGRVQAKDVSFMGEGIGSHGRSYQSVWIAGVFLGAVAGAVLAGALPVGILVVYLVTSVIAFCAYALDKSAARRDAWRTRESTLHLMALLGGWPGALVAQWVFRHKTSKTSFQISFWVTVVVNCVALGWLISPAGRSMLQDVFALL